PSPAACNRPSRRTGAARATSSGSKSGSSAASSAWVSTGPLDSSRRSTCNIDERTQTLVGLASSKLVQFPPRKEKRDLPGGRVGRVRGEDRVPLLGLSVQPAHRP